MALLIGNQKYDSGNLNKLQHTENEIRKVAEKLRDLHFKVCVQLCIIHVVYSVYIYIV